jgi:regulatory protein
VKDRPDPDAPAALRARALRLLARREHSKAELQRKLSAHAASSAALDELLSLLESKKQLSDERYAAERARILSRKFGAARIRHDLKSNGIAEEISARLVSNSEEMEKAKAKAILARKYREPAATREERAKRMRFLQSRGFSSEIIFSLLSARGLD